MRVLIVGASGFIGRHIAIKAADAGHEIISCGRNISRLNLRFPSWKAVPCNLAKDSAADWRERLSGVDAVVNAAGIFQSEKSNSLEAVHVTGPRALFDACAEARVARLIQISALGADSHAQSQFQLTKCKADEYCLELAERNGLRGWIVVRPSLVIGRGGQSTALFSALAALQWPPRLGAGSWKMQPVHVSDLAHGVCLLLEQNEAPRQLDFAGPRAMTTDQLTHTLRRWLLLPPAKVMPVPERLLRFASRFGSLFSLGAFSREGVEMLARGNTTSIAPLQEALHWQPRPLANALSGEPSTQADLWQARLFFLKPALRLGLGVLWIATAIVSAFAYPLEKSTAMVAGLGVSESQAAALVYAGAAVDAALGFALLLNMRPALVGLLQLVVIAVFTVLATIAVPQAWSEPFGPLTKNLAVVLATLAMIALESRS
jgi:nucleoside-diphosphate-sugar epimerase